MSDERQARFFSPSEPEGRWVSTDGDPIRKAITEILYGIDADLEEFGWDLPPMLFWLWRYSVEVPPDKMPSDMSGDYSGFAFSVSRVPIPNELWVQAERPVDLLWWLCDVMEDLLRDMQARAADELMAYIFASEAWGVRSMSREQRRRNDREARKRKLHVHPDRIELRQLTAADSAGELYHIEHERDGVVLEASAEDSKHFSGGVPDALRQLLTVSRGEADPGT